MRDLDGSASQAYIQHINLGKIQRIFGTNSLERKSKQILCQGKE